MKFFFNQKILFFLPIIFAVIFSLANFSAAANLNDAFSNNLQMAGQKAKFVSNTGASMSLDEMITFRVAGMVLFIGLAVVLVIVYAGFMWMTAGGNEEQIKKAKKLMTNAILGLAVLVSAYIITYFIVSYFITGPDKKLGV